MKLRIDKCRDEKNVKEIANNNYKPFSLIFSIIYYFSVNIYRHLLHMGI